MQKIAICGKGGCGKSVTTRLLADGLAVRGHRVLVVDADESNTGLPRMLGFNGIEIIAFCDGRQLVDLNLKFLGQAF